MKSVIILFVISFLAGVSLFGQSLNLLNSGCIWNNLEQTFQAEDCCLFTHSIKFSGDTVLQAIVYKKVLQSDDSIRSKWKTVGFVRENLQKGLYYRDMNNNERLLYNYNLRLNDTVKIPSVFAGEDSVSFVVSNIENVLINGNTRKKYMLVYPEYHNFTETWIEEIGSLQGILRPGYNGAGSIQKVLCCFKDEVLIYKNPDYNRCYYSQITGVDKDRTESPKQKIYPNPVTGELFIQSNSTNEEGYTLELYSVKGELVKTGCLEGGSNLHRIDVSSLKSGVYVVRLISASGRYSEEVIIKE